MRAYLWNGLGAQIRRLEGFVGAGVALAFCLGGCGDASDFPRERVEVTRDELAAWDITMWPRQNGQYLINVCFMQNTDLGTPIDWAGDKLRAQAALVGTWQAYSGIAFSFQGDCPALASIPDDWMPIELRYVSANPGANGGKGWPGMHGRHPECVGCQAFFNYGQDYSEFETYLVHEVGHALGMRHEFSRADFPTCWDVENMRLLGAENTEGGPHLTATPDLDSIMSYWECTETRRHDSFAYYQLSDGDKAGISMMYPKSLSRLSGSIRSHRGFPTAGGLVIRTDGSVVTDWTAMNASTDVFKTVPRWYVRAPGSTTFTAIAQTYELAAADLSAQSFDQVRFIYADHWNRFDSGTDGVIINNSLHTALLNSVTEML